MRINSVKKENSDQTETSKIMRLAAVRPTWRHFCCMDFKVKGSSAWKALHDSNQWSLHRDRRVYFTTTSGEHNRVYHSDGSTSQIYCIPPRKISRRLRTNRPKPFIYRSTPNHLPTPYMYKYAFFLLDVPIFQNVLVKCHPQTGYSGFLVHGEKGEGKGKEQNHFLRRKSTTAMPFWWLPKRLNKFLYLKVKCFCWRSKMLLLLLEVSFKFY